MKAVLKSHPLQYLSSKQRLLHKSLFGLGSWSPGGDWADAFVGSPLYSEALKLVRQRMVLCTQQNAISDAMEATYSKIQEAQTDDDRLKMQLAANNARRALDVKRRDLQDQVRALSNAQSALQLRLVDWKIQQAEQADRNSGLGTPSSVAAKSEKPSLWKAMDDALEVINEANAPGNGELPAVPDTPRRPARQEPQLAYRIDILGDCALSLNEQVALAKSIAALPEGSQQTALLKSGLKVLGPRRVDLQKSRMSVAEFADAVGTTPDTVRRLARRCGSVDHFTTMIRDKMPDIMRAHGLNQTECKALYNSALRTLKSLDGGSWNAWKSTQFGRAVPNDTQIARSILEHGYMHQNQQQTREGFVRHTPHRELASPDPISALDTRPLET